MKNNTNNLCKSYATNKTRLFILASLMLAYLLLLAAASPAAIKTSIASGTWENASNWSPNGIPSPNDDVIIGSNTTISLNSLRQANDLTVASSATLILSPEISLASTGNITVNGTLDMNGGNVTSVSTGKQFNLGPSSVFTWKPGNNTESGATLLTRSVESFNPTSTFIVKKWYDYTIPLGAIVSGDFGNLTLNSTDGSNSIVEWNQQNMFQTHRVNGTLTVDQGWITLDKSSMITTTTIGQIVLSSINSTFIGHHGNHNSSFTIQAGNITNNGGNFYGLNDGNGNINLNVSGNFNNSGNVKIINNTGVSGVSNGNANIQISGNYNQSFGDTRFIYNLATTNSGVFTASINNLYLNGGIFMGQNACHIDGKTNNLQVINDLIINFQQATDKFRGNGLTSIGASVNNAKLTLSVGRNLEINGTGQAEFTGSASSGMEVINISGDLLINGCTNSFNYGATAAAHITQILIGGNVHTNNGTVFFSKNAGQLNGFIGKNLTLSGGSLSIKGNNGFATWIVNGSFSQTGGLLTLHANNSLPTTDAIRLEVKGEFNQSGGRINYDDNTIGAQHTISLQGNICKLSGEGVITRAGAGTSDFFGFLNFDKAGRLTYQRKGNARNEQIIQTIKSGCELYVENSLLELSSHATNLFHALKIYPGGKITLRNSTVSSNKQFVNCSMSLDSSATFSFENEKGFYGKNGTALTTSVDYFLNKESILEFRGKNKQLLTGNKTSNLVADKKYGILRIKPENGKCDLWLSGDVVVRTRLELEGGTILLKGNSIILENGLPSAIKRTKGSIVMDESDPVTGSSFVWKNITTGKHEIPIGNQSTAYLPVIFYPTQGTGNELKLSTHPLANDSQNSSAVQAPPLSDPLAIGKAYRRYWSILAPGLTADVTFTINKDENLPSTDWNSADFNVLEWKEDAWESRESEIQNKNVQNKTVTIRNQRSWSNFVIVPDTTPLHLKLKKFNAKDLNAEIEITWEVYETNLPVNYTIEKSTDGINFFVLARLENTNSSSNNEFKYIDNESTAPIAYYRIKIDKNESDTGYSSIKSVKRIGYKNDKSVLLQHVYPNPFTDRIEVSYSSRNAVSIHIIDAQGKTVFVQEESQKPENSRKTTLDLRELKKGFYFLILTDGEKKETKKIIKNE